MQPIAQSPRRLHRTLGDGIAVRWRHFAIWFGAPTAMDSPARLGADQAAGFRSTAFLIAQSGWQLLAMPADRLPRAPRAAELVSLSLPRARHGAVPAERIPSGPGHEGDGAEADGQRRNCPRAPAGDGPSRMQIERHQRDNKELPPSFAAAGKRTASDRCSNKEQAQR
jgi:hypothetical protein